MTFEFGVVGLRGLAFTLQLAGQAKLAEFLYDAADASESGINIDNAMAEVSLRLKERPTVAADFAEAHARIKADLARLNA